ncbi:MAG: HPr kinase/phosphatase C-terminal domain-containing protein [Desulfomonilaceae bacterium]
MDARKISGVLVRVHGVGVLIRGHSGAGKSLAALSLMQRGHSLISDDLVEVIRGPQGAPIGRSVEQEVRVEVRGLGVFPARSLFRHAVAPSTPIDFIVDLDAYDHALDAGRIVPQTGKFRILEHDVLTVRVPVATGVDPGLLIELLAWHFKESGTVTP